MPDLGKAVYTLALSTTAIDGPLQATERRVDIATDKMAADFAQVEGQMTLFGDTAVATAAKVTASAEEQAAAVAASTAEMTAAEIAYAEKSIAASKLYSAGWAAAHTKVQTMAAATTKHLKLAALGAVAFIAMSGVEDLKEGNAAMAQVEAHIKSTGGVAGVSAKHVEALSKQWIKLAGVEDEATVEASGLLLTFTKIRNMSGKGNNIFDQTVTAVQNVAAAFHKTLPQAAILVGKALNDPMKGLTALTRVGIQFTAAQKLQVKALIETGHGIEAQKIILGELTRQTGGAAIAAGKTFEGQMRRVKEELGNSSAVIVTSFLPAFKTIISILAAVAGVMAHHTTIVKTLVFAYIAWKVALIAFAAVEKTIIAVTKTRLALELLSIRRSGQAVVAAEAATIALGQQAIAEQAVGNSAATAATKVGLLRGGLLKLAAMSLIKIGIVYTITYNIIKHLVPGQEDLGLDFSNAAGAGENKNTSGYGPKGTDQEAFNKKRDIKVDSKGRRTEVTGNAVWRMTNDKEGRWVNPKTGKPLTQAGQKAADAGWKRTRPIGHGKDRPNEGSVTGLFEGDRAKGQKNPSVADLNKDFQDGAITKKQRDAGIAKARKKQLQEKMKKERHQRDVADAKWQVEEAQSERKGEAAHKAALIRHANYLKKTLATQKMDIKVRAQYEQELTATLQTIESMEKDKATKEAKRPKLDLFPAILKARVAKAGKNRNEAIKAWSAEKRHLQALLAMSKYNAEEKAKIQEQIYLVDTKIQNLKDGASAAAAKSGLEGSNKDRIALARAERTETLKDDLKYWNSREKAVRLYLKGLLASKKRDLSKIADAEEELTRIVNQIKSLKESMSEKANDSNKLSLDLLNLKTEIFGNFAGNFFTQTNTSTVVPPAAAPATTTPSATPPRRFSAGGRVPGSGSGDTVPAMLTPGELVLNKKQQKRFGILHMAGGGVVPGRSRLGAMFNDHGTWKLGISGEPTVPLGRSIEKFFERWSGRGLSPARALEAEKFWDRWGNQIIMNSKMNSRQADTGDRPNNTTVNVNQHFPEPTTGGRREARYARMAMQAAFDG